MDEITVAYALNGMLCLETAAGVRTVIPRSRRHEFETHWRMLYPGKMLPWESHRGEPDRRPPAAVME